MTEPYRHEPVLLEEAIAALRIRQDGVYIDGTYGRGGHSGAILERLGPHGRLLALDKDPQAVQHAREAKGRDGRFDVVQGSYAMLERQAQVWGVVGRVDGILLDLGVSSPQLEDAARGFSFRLEGPLDMRMDPTTGVSAAEWLGSAAERDIAAVLKTYGEERFAKRIAHAIAQARMQGPIVTTRRLAEIVAAAHPRWEPGKDPATRSFQAIRIYINRELEDLEAVLPQAIRVLAPGGRLVVISFHSLEDRIVKRFMQEQARGDRYPRHLPVRAAELAPALYLVGKAIAPGAAELARNPRARSAVMRVAERLA